MIILLMFYSKNMFIKYKSQLYKQVNLQDLSESDTQYLVDNCNIIDLAHPCISPSLLYTTDTAPLNNPAIYYDESLELWTSWAIPQDRPYNKMTSDGRKVTFMTGNAYKKLLWNKLQKFKTRTQAYPAIAKKFGITLDEAIYLCSFFLKENATIINKLLKNQQAAGFQNPDGKTWDEDYLCCWLDFEVDGELVYAKVGSGGGGGLDYGGEDYGHFALSV